MSTKTKIKQLITAYLNFKEVYEAGLTEKQLTKVRNIMYDFSSFIDETTINEFDIDDDEDYTSNNNENNSSHMQAILITRNMITCAMTQI